MPTTILPFSPARDLRTISGPLVALALAWGGLSLPPAIAAAPPAESGAPVPIPKAPAFKEQSASGFAKKEHEEKLGGSPSLSELKPTAAEKKIIDNLIQDLADPVWRTREKAQRQLSQLGRLPKAALEKGLQDSDPERVHRAESLFNRIRGDEIFDLQPISLQGEFRIEQLVKEFESRARLTIKLHPNLLKDELIKVNFTGSTFDVLTQIAKKTGAELHIEEFAGQGTLVLAPVSKKCVLRTAVDRNVMYFVKVENDARSDDLHVRIYAISGGRFGLAGASLNPKLINAETEKSEKLTVIAQERDSYVKANTISTRFISMSFRLARPRDKAESIASLDMEFMLTAFGEELSFTAPIDDKAPPFIKDFGNFKVEVQGYHCQPLLCFENTICRFFDGNPYIPEAPRVRREDPLNGSKWSSHSKFLPSTDGSVFTSATFIRNELRHDTSATLHFYTNAATRPARVRFENVPLPAPEVKRKPPGYVHET